jgi:hypothetical protein
MVNKTPQPFEPVETARDRNDDWVEFPGGELAGKRPKALCPACRDHLKRVAAEGTALDRPGTLCFQCYRAELDREQAMKAAGELNTASVERFQSSLPFEPVNQPRLERLKADRGEARAAELVGIGQYADRRRRAQIAARHALQSIAAGLAMRRLAPEQHERVLAMAAHVAELQLPESWLPFVMAR